MNIHYPRLRSLALLLASGFTGDGFASDLNWDGPDAGGTGDGASSYLGGTWSTTDANWDQGAGLARLVWDNTNDAGNPADNAIFGGDLFTTDGTRVVTIGSDITVNQILINTGTGPTQTAPATPTRYDIGADPAQNDFAITFGGSYSDTFPTITGPGGTNGFLHNDFNAKITGDLSAKGGLVIRHGSPISSLPNLSTANGRLLLANTSNDFVGNVVLLGGNLAGESKLGNAANKLVLNGGSLFFRGNTATTTPLSRDIDVASQSGIGSLATTGSPAAGFLLAELTGKITGSANLTRYYGGGNNTVLLHGDMSGYTGTVENTGTGGSTLDIQTTAMSQGGWKISGGILKLSGTTNDSHIANGAGKPDLVMVVPLGVPTGVLNMNGKSETINGLSGEGFVQSQLAGSISVLTLGDGDASASFSGVIRNNSSSANTARVHLTKIGTGVQTLTGNSTYSGATLVNAGTLEVNGPNGKIVSPATVAATLSGTGTVGALTTTATGVISPAGGLVGTLTTAPNATFVTTSDVTLIPGSKLVAQLDSSAAPPASDRLNVGGNLDLGGATLEITDLGAATLAATTRLVLATATGTITGTLAGRANNSNVVIGTNTYTIRYDDTENGLNAVTITVSEPAGGYAAWAALAGVGAADADDDNDGLDNGVEYVLGTNPKTGNTGGLNAAVSGGNVTFTFTRSDASETPDAAVSIQVGTNLTTWPSVFTVGADAASSSPGVSVIENPAAPGADPGTDLISVTVPIDGNLRTFGRLRVVITP